MTVLKILGSIFTIIVWTFCLIGYFCRRRKRKKEEIERNKSVMINEKYYEMDIKSVLDELFVTVRKNENRLDLIEERLNSFVLEIKKPQGPDPRVKTSVKTINDLVKCGDYELYENFAFLEKFSFDINETMTELNNFIISKKLSDREIASVLSRLLSILDDNSREEAFLASCVRHYMFLNGIKGVDNNYD